MNYSGYSNIASDTTIKAFYTNAVDVFGASSIISYFPCNELSGATLTDSKNGYNGSIYNASYNIDALNGKAINLDTGFGNIEAAANQLNKDEGSILFWIRSGQWISGVESKYIFRFRNTTDVVEISLNVTSVNTIYFMFKRNGVTKGIYEAMTSDNWMFVALTWSVLNDRINGYLDGCPFNITPTASGITSWSGSFTSGACGLMSSVSSSKTNGLQGDISNILLLNKECTESELYSFCPWNQMVFDGDSRTAGNFWQGIGVNSNYIAKRNAAISGATIASRITNAPTDVDPFIRAGKKNYVIVWAGVNDYKSDGGNQSVPLYNYLKTYCEDRKAAGFDKVIVCSEIDCQSSVSGWHSLTFPSVNILLRADHSFADGFVDLGANVELQDATNTTYFNSDKIHLTNAGYTIVGNTVKAALQNMGIIV